MKKLYLLIVFLSVLSQAQKPEEKAKVDSVLTVLKGMKQDTAKVNMLNKLTTRRGFLYFDQPMRKKLIEESLRIVNQINYKKGEGDAYISLGYYYSTEFNKEKALQSFEKALARFTALKDSAKISKLYNAIGNIHADYNDYPTALSYYFKAVKINEQTKNYNNIVGNYNNIATIYNGLGDVKKTIHYGNLSIKYAQLTQNDAALIANYLMFTKLYINQNDLERAQRYVDQAYRLSVATDDLNNIAVSLIGLGSIQKKQKNYTQAIGQFTKALQHFTTIGNSLGCATAYSELGLSYYLLYETNKNKTFLEKSKYNLTQSNQIYIADELIDGLPENYLHLSKIYEIEKNYKASLANFKLHTQYKDSIFNADKKETIKNMEDQREIEFRDKQLKINELTLQSKEKQRWLLLAGLAFVTAVGGLLFYQSAKRKQTNRKLLSLNQDLDAKNIELDAANKAKTRFFSILNHDLRGPVANLIFFLQLQKESPDLLDQESTKRMQDKTMEGAENLLSSMEDILQWSKSQMENFKPQPRKIDVSSVFEDIKNHFISEENIQISFENPDHIQLVTDENYLKTILRNLTGNAVKALKETQNPNITWKAWRENSLTFLSITDNGKGASDEQFRALYDEKEVSGIKTGLGLHLIRDLAKAIDCTISVNSQQTGTTITLKLP